MNVLGEEQKRVYEKGISEKEYCLRKKRFLEHYYSLRNKEEQSFLGRMTLPMRKKLHGFILTVYTIKNKLGGFRYEIIYDKRKKTDRPIIFAATHVGKFDIEIITEAIKDHYYLLSGDYEHLQGTVDAPFLNANGVVYFNEKVRSDRRDALNKMNMLLQEGANLLYFPEGTWNLSPNLPVLPCYWGIIEVAKRGGL